MFNRYSLGATVLAVFLLAIFGISRAFNWLRESPGTDFAADGGASVEDARPAARPADAPFDRTANSANGDSFIDNDRVASSADDALSEDVLAPTALETAGTYVQRQKGAELDQLIADSSVEVTPLATDSVPIQDNNQVNDTQLDSTGDTTGGVGSGSTAPAAQSVPALW